MKTYKYAGTTNDWSTPGNWMSSGVPGAGDDVFIDNNSAPQITTDVGTVKSVNNTNEIDLTDNGALTTLGDFTNGGTTTVGVHVFGAATTQLTVGGTFVNSATDPTTGFAGHLEIGNTAFNAGPSTVHVGNISNAGSAVISVQGNSTGRSQLLIDGQAGFGTAGVVTGTVGVYDNSLIQFAGGKITTISNQGGGITIDSTTGFIADAGATNSNSALDHLSENDAVLGLYRGASVSTVTDLFNKNFITIDGNVGSPSGGVVGGSSLSVQGTLTNAANAYVYVGFLNEINGGTSQLTVGSLVNASTVQLAGGSNAATMAAASLIVHGADSGAGKITLSTNSSVEFGAAASNNIVMSGSGNAVMFDDPHAGYTGTISGFRSGDTLDLAGETVTIQSYDGMTLTVQVTGSSLARSATSGAMTAGAPVAGEIQSFMLTGPAADSLTATSDGRGGTLISIACFATGTLIRTSRGDVAVERLTVGDCVSTIQGSRPIRWLGHRTLRPYEHPVPSDVWPVRILAGAFGDGLPARDLLLSPGHPVLVGADIDTDADGAGGCLVPVMCLINGTTIAKVEVERVTYWHVELDAHDVLLAEGLPAESYLDWGDRAFFDDGADHALANPDFVVPGLAARCRPVAVDGPAVEAERRRLDAVLAMRLVAACAWPSGDEGAVAALQ